MDWWVLLAFVVGVVEGAVIRAIAYRKGFNEGAKLASDLILLTLVKERGRSE